MNTSQHRTNSVNQRSLEARVHSLAYRISLGFVFFIPLESLLTVRFFGMPLGSLSRVYAVLVAIVWIAAVIRADCIRYPDLFHWTAYLFFTWSTLSFAWSSSVDLTIGRTKTYVQMFLMLWILWDLYQSTSEVRTALEAYVLGAYVAIAILLTDYFSSYGSASLRYTVGEFNPNGFALLIAIGIPLAWHLAAHNIKGVSDKRFLRSLYWLYAPVALFAIMLTGSRGGLVASVPAVLFILWDGFRSGRTRALIWLMAILALVVGFYQLVPSFLIDRLSTIPAEIMRGDLGRRRLVWRDGLFIFREHPLLGIGSGAFRVALRSIAGWAEDKVAHNTFLSILVETGIVGFGLFLAALLRAVVVLIRQRQANFEVWLVVLLVWALGVFNITWEHEKATWLIMLLALASSKPKCE